MPSLSPVIRLNFIQEANCNLNIGFVCVAGDGEGGRVLSLSLQSAVFKSVSFGARLGGLES